MLPQAENRGDNGESGRRIPGPQHARAALPGLRGLGSHRARPLISTEVQLGLQFLTPPPVFATSFCPS